jgi:hypothetical protein
MEKRMARFIQGDRPEAGPELAMTGWKLARLFLGVVIVEYRINKRAPSGARIRDPYCALKLRASKEASTWGSRTKWPGTDGDWTWPLMPLAPDGTAKAPLRLL